MKQHIKYTSICLLVLLASTCSAQFIRCPTGGGYPSMNTCQAGSCTEHFFLWPDCYSWVDNGYTMCGHFPVTCCGGTFTPYNRYVIIPCTWVTKLIEKNAKELAALSSDRVILAPNCSGAYVALNAKELRSQ